MGRETVSKILEPLRKLTVNPIGASLAIGAGGAALGYGLWDNIVNTGGSLGRWPIKALTGMSDEEYNEAMDELAQDKRYKYILPGALAAILGGGFLASQVRGSQPYLGLTKWSSLNKEADELWSYGGYVPDVDFSQVINSRSAKQMFTNDPHLQDDPYVRNMGVAIISDAANRAGYTNPTLGNVYDSARDKMSSKLSLSGVAGVAAKTMIANATAHLFTGALGAVLPLSDKTKQNLIDAGTWYTAVSSILN